MAQEKISAELLELLACPVDKKPLKYDKKENILVCPEKHAYKIKDNILFLTSKASPEIQK